MELKLYVEDFRKVTDWFAICKQVGVDITSTVITIQVKKAIGEQAEEEKELCEGCNQEVPLSEMSEVMEMYICEKCEEGTQK